MARRAAGFSREVSSRQLWCAVSATRRSRCPYASKPGRSRPSTSPSSSRTSRLSSTSSTRVLRNFSSSRLRRCSRLWGTTPSGSGESTLRQSSSRAEHSGASRNERKSTTAKCAASCCMARTTRADLPMPPMPSTLTSRQSSSTTQRQGRQFLFAVIEGGHVQRLAPIHSSPWRRLSRGHLTSLGFRQRHRGQQGQCRTWPAEQCRKPGFIQQHLLACRKPEYADLLFLAPGGKGLLLHPQH